MTTTTNTAAAISSCTDRQFTKKPVTIQAIQWTGRNLREVIAFTDGPPDTRSHHAGMAWEAYADLVARDGLMIYTLEDGPDRRAKHFADIGDWIIRGVKGEYYPCKPDIFEATYSRTALAAELPRQSAEIETLRAGYAAARLEIESLKAQSGYGPNVTVRRSCSDCKACNSESYAVQGDSGHYVYCEHPSLPESKYIGDTNWNTPHWCPVSAPTTQPAPAAEWQDISTAPNDGRTLLLGYFNSAGNWRTLRGRWVNEDYISAFWKEPENGEPGWYECAVEADNEPNCWATDPTHWMPLPSPPARKG
jgi:hypothetical protein